ncbi:NADPH-dependent ferric siderophore reductase, contains FAD-binding and SIP domains [Fulvimarina manganoxydans]|uniref:NADPH-dependent ferric siderophore reductase, contains FAD-binding and SIP domains n=1 Tax=Fulvimarina manganoxydans TaxID=937218 RepID=A0A1W2AR04_9HYPH|nr:siderophore-interacting protein [Fulvimarina manganoxydans]SMC63147.1 NADPH-dependent ferric siderophore reductase, contains FAD-binding and SIP domains [Fulvimarina manganoxydans]
MSGTATLEAPHFPTRHRHEVRLRRLTLRRLIDLTPTMRRLTFGGDAMEGFVSLGFDDHVKMFFPAPGESEPRLPSVGPDGLEMPKDPPKPIARDYTVRSHDLSRGELDIDFVLHDHGPASDWARSVRIGDPAWIAGPRGSFVLPTDFDAYLLIADEPGFPAVARRLEELPAGAQVTVLLECAGPEGKIGLRTDADARIVWAHRGGAEAGDSDALIEQVRGLDLPAGDVSVWIACESAIAKRLRSHLVAERGLNPKWVRASGYWRRGDSGVHDHFDD